MRPVQTLFTVLILSLAGCGMASDSEETPRSASPTTDLAWHQLDDAVRVWRLGAEAWQRPPAQEVEESDLEEELEEIEELDLNPFIVNSNRADCAIVDARIRIGGKRK